MADVGKHTNSMQRVCYGILQHFRVASNIWLSTFHLLARIRLQKASKNAAVTLSRKPFKV
jgi:hypothetical protein